MKNKFVPYTLYLKCGSCGVKSEILQTDNSKVELSFDYPSPDSTISFKCVCGVETELSFDNTSRIEFRDNVIDEILNSDF